MWFWKYNSPIDDKSKWHRVRSMSIDTTPKYSMFGDEKDEWTFWLTAYCGTTGQSRDIEMELDDDQPKCERCSE